MNAAENKFDRFLKSKGMKLTPERKILLEEVLSLKRHFDTEELFQSMYFKKRKISRASVYRNLPLLVKANLIIETLKNKSKTSYEHKFGQEHHDHMLCIKCGKVIEFKDDSIEELQEKICAEYGFKMTEHRLGIKGICRKCSGKKKRS